MERRGSGALCLGCRLERCLVAALSSPISIKEFATQRPSSCNLSFHSCFFSGSLLDFISNLACRARS